MLSEEEISMIQCHCAHFDDQIIGTGCGRGEFNDLEAGFQLVSSVEGVGMYVRVVYLSRLPLYLLHDNCFGHFLAIVVES